MPQTASTEIPSIQCVTKTDLYQDMSQHSAHKNGLQMYEAVSLSKAVVRFDDVSLGNWHARNKQVPRAVGDRVEASVVACIYISCLFFG